MSKPKKQPPASLAAAHGSVRKSYGELARLYNELLYAVARTFDGESRHETALRYIREKEEDHSLSASGESTSLNTPDERPPQPK